MIRKAIFYLIIKLILKKTESKKSIENFNEIIQDNVEKENLKKLFLEEIFLQKNTAINYEVSNNFFNEIDIEPFGNCFYCCISYYLYKEQNKHLEIRKAIFNYIENNPESFYTFFEGNDFEDLNNLSPEMMLENYINDNNKEGEFAGDIEYTAACKLLNIRIILFTKGYLGLNIFNIYSPDSNDDNTYSNIYILFKNQDHFNYL